MMPSKKKRAQSRQRPSNVWTHNLDGTFSVAVPAVATVSSKHKENSDCQETSWAQLLNPDSGKCAEKSPQKDECDKIDVLTNDMAKCSLISEESMKNQHEENKRMARLIEMLTGFVAIFSKTDFSINIHGFFFK